MLETKSFRNLARSRTCHVTPEPSALLTAKLSSGGSFHHGVPCGRWASG